MGRVPHPAESKAPPGHVRPASHPSCSEVGPESLTEGGRNPLWLFVVGWDRRVMSPVTPLPFVLVF